MDKSYMYCYYSAINQLSTMAKKRKRTTVEVTGSKVNGQGDGDNFFDKKGILFFYWVSPQPPLVTGGTGLHHNATSADACRWNVVTNNIIIHVKWTHLWKIVKKIRNWIIGLKFFPLENENSLLYVKKITALATVSFLFYRLKMKSFLYSLDSRQMRKKNCKMSWQKFECGKCSRMMS